MDHCQAASFERAQEIQAFIQALETWWGIRAEHAEPCQDEGSAVGYVTIKPDEH